jgi:hypothetical protein
MPMTQDLRQPWSYTDRFRWLTDAGGNCFPLFNSRAWSKFAHATAAFALKKE